ncbi:MAG: phosphatase PAP2 family protein [Bacteroidales bacterium]|nr:phosphatase PAP2 family protein [Bacteroidales bacterium]
MQLRIVTFLLFVFILSGLKAQNSDSLSIKRRLKKTIAPVSMIGLGLILNNSRLERNLQSDLTLLTPIPIDDYTQYAPIATMYIADLAGVKSKNHWFDQSKYLFISNALTAAITHGLKIIINKTRPDGTMHSFPSGHTSFAFTNAAVLYQEFHQTSKPIAYSGYAFALTTGTFRVLNNKHWVSDVLVGAGIGVIVTEFVYYFEPLKNFNPFRKSENIFLVPYANGDTYGFYFSYQF